MNTNPLKIGLLTHGAQGNGTVNRGMVRQRAVELALMNGRTPHETSKADWEEALTQLTGISRTEDSTVGDPESPDSRTSVPPGDDEDEEGRTDQVLLVEEGLVGAELDHRIQAAESDQDTDRWGGKRIPEPGFPSDPDAPRFLACRCPGPPRPSSSWPEGAVPREALLLKIFGIGDPQSVAGGRRVEFHGKTSVAGRTGDVELRTDALGIRGWSALAGCLPSRQEGWQTAKINSMKHLLAINAGSSSVRFTLFSSETPLVEFLSGMLDQLDADGCRLTIQGRGSEKPRISRMDGAPAESLLDWLESQVGLGDLRAVGHRIVHGLRHTEPEWVTEELINELGRIRPYAPEHLPREISFIEAVRRRFPELPQLACFDTAFHRTMPKVASLIPIPASYRKGGVQRYGFHGISYTYLIHELAVLGDEAASRGRVILAHLGNGASLAAVRAGKGVETTMGFTPASGLPMGTRSGDLDPGLFAYLAEKQGMTPAEFDWMVNHESGLLAVSETTSDMRELLLREAEDERAAEAVDLFCYQVRKWVGAMAAVLGGVDTLVFAGGIGENCPSIRARVCGGLGHLGLELDPLRNEGTPGVISSGNSRVSIRVLPTNEALMVARFLLERLQSNGSPELTSLDDSGAVPAESALLPAV